MAPFLTSHMHLAVHLQQSPNSLLSTVPNPTIFSISLYMSMTKFSSNPESPPLSADTLSGPGYITYDFILHFEYCRACQLYLYQTLPLGHAEGGGLGSPMLVKCCSFELGRRVCMLRGTPPISTSSTSLSPNPVCFASLVTVYSCRTTIPPFRSPGISGDAGSFLVCSTNKPSSLSLSRG